MKRWLKISLKVLSGLVLLIIAVWLAAAYYINHNNKTILATILSQLNSNVNGKIEVSSMETTLLKGFPGAAVSLKNVRLQDSLWSVHRHDLLNASDIDVSLNIFSLIAGNIKINKIGVNNAKIYVYTDSTGYTNTSMFKRKVEKKEPSNAEQKAFEIRRIDFSKVDLTVDNRRRFKLFNFMVEELRGKIDYPDSGWNGNLKLKTIVKSFAFNTKKGSFLEGKSLEGTLTAHYNNERQDLVIEQKKLTIGKDEFLIGAKIDLAENKSAFAINVRADNILYQNVSLLLSPNISSKLLRFVIDKPIAVVGTITDDGSKNHHDPLIDVRIQVKNNGITIPSGRLTNCSFVGTFTNRDTVGNAIGDRNSAIRFFGLTADYYSAPIKIDTFSITNLERPIAAGLITSQFQLDRLNQSFGGETFNFKKGSADVRLYCKTDIDNFEFVRPILSGNVIIKDADITYVPRNMRLVNSHLTLNFNQKDLNITNSRFQLGKSILNMNCSIHNFLNFYYTDPEKVIANLNLSSPSLSLSEFMSFLGARKTVKKKAPKKHDATSLADQLADVLEASRVNIKLNVNKATYKRFEANNLAADISMFGDGIYFNKINISHAGGKLNLTGNIKQSGAINKFKLNSVISKVNVKQFFYAFENFGQNSITSQNLKGYLSAKVDASGSITDQGKIVSRAMYGQVIFNLNNAALVNFEPLQKVQKFAFKSRDFKNITIDKLDGTLTLKGDKIEIQPMQVNTSVINFNMKGIYGLSNGTEIALDIPLRNPKKNEGITDKEELKLARMKGIVLHLKAIDDGNGGIKVRWNSDHD
ncbi:MAG: AsmA family protein [Pedobacter sp.]|nr:MAG: AsmA family protein [Pedobacter sp.]